MQYKILVCEKWIMYNHRRVILCYRPSNVFELQIWFPFTARLCKLHRWQKLCCLLTVCIFIRLNHAKNEVSCGRLCSNIYKMIIFWYIPLMHYYAHNQMSQRNIIQPRKFKTKLSSWDSKACQYGGKLKYFKWKWFFVFFFNCRL